MLLGLPSQGTFNGVIVIEVTVKARDFVFRQVSRATLRVDTQRVTDLNRRRLANPKQIGERDVRRLGIRNVDTLNTWHISATPIEETNNLFWRFVPTCFVFKQPMKSVQWL